MSEKARPFTEEQRNDLRSLDFSDEAIADLETKNSYRPNVDGLMGLTLAVAMLRTLTTRMGSSFAQDVRTQLLNRRDGMLAEDETVDAEIVDAMLDNPIWAVLTMSSGEAA